LFACSTYVVSHLYIADTVSIIVRTDTALQRSTTTGARKWSKAEQEAVERQMGVFLRAFKLPGMQDCTSCLSKETILVGRSWRNVKDYVRNRIVALQRKASF
jgi:hypothetical protein